MQVALGGGGARSGEASGAVRLGWRRGGERRLEEIGEKAGVGAEFMLCLALLENFRHYDMESDSRNGSDGWCLAMFSLGREKNIFFL